MQVRVQEKDDRLPFLFHHQHGTVTVWAKDNIDACVKARTMAHGLPLRPAFEVPAEYQ